MAEGRAALARIKERKAEIVGAYWDIGDDLLVLAQPGMADAFGYRDLYDLCRKEAKLAEEQVDELLKIRRQLTRAEAIRLETRSKAAAYLALAAATPADDTAMELFEHGAKPPRGSRLPPGANVRAVQRAAKEFRQVRRGTRRGRTTTPDERAVGAAIRDALRHAGVHAKVDVLATVPGKPAKLRIEVSVADIAALRRALPAKRS